MVSRSVVLRALGALSLSITACSGSDANSGDGGTLADAAPPSCDERLPLTIGHCVEADTGYPCVSGESEMQRFRSLMFVMAIQGQGIATGENQDAPRVDVRVFDGEQDVGGFSSNPIVIESTDAPGLITAPRLFVVSFFADELEGKTLDVTAGVVDKNGQSFCATDSFEVGALIDAEPQP